MSVADDEQQAAGDKWGDEISDERKAWLEQRLQVWEQEAEHGERKGPFDPKGLSDEDRERLWLRGAEVFWLAARTLAGTSEVQTLEEQMESLCTVVRVVPEHIDWPTEDPLMHALHLEGAWLGGADLEKAYLRGAHLESALLDSAQLAGAFLVDARLQRANLTLAHLEKACLKWARLEGTDFSDAHLEGADLREVHLEGADLRQAHLQGANLFHASLDDATNLRNVEVSDQAGWLPTIIGLIRQQRRYGPVSLGDVRWNGADVTIVDWSVLRSLGDEWDEDAWLWRSRADLEYATRANIQLSKQLDNAGIKDDSDRFAYRAQVCQRGVHLRSFRLGRWLFSWLLFIIAGYGYRPLRTLFWYLAIILGFALAYVHFGHINGQPFEFDEALVFSVTSFHGRGFFPATLSLKDLVTKLAAAEAVLGLFIELSFIATFTQRYFGK